MSNDGPLREMMVERAASILDRDIPLLDEGVLERFVSRFIDDRARFLDLADSMGSPLYVIDRAGIRSSMRRFCEAFSVLPGPVEIYFAVKSNNAPAVTESVLEAGGGLDVSSGAELQAALDAGAERIVFSGPGKTEKELSLALKNNHCVTLLIDSFGELDRLDAVSRKWMRKIHAGVRLTASRDPLWRKFGIPCSSLERFFRLAGPMPFVEVDGIQFHTSWNRGPEAQTAFIEDLADTLHELPGSFLRKIRFIDIGGGYWPEQGEWLRPAGTETGRLRAILSGGRFDPRERYCLESMPLEGFAASISETLKQKLPEEMECTFYLEPGRWICHENMHILLSVIDVKGLDFVITDAGTNAIGWERFEHDYFPVINLSRPSTLEHDCHIFGSLCTPHDIWGYSYHGQSIREGDILLIPAQGAYTFSLRQNFIKHLPRAVSLPAE